jgi:predicted enzyme related to lactoylglutathione lyase
MTDQERAGEQEELEEGQTDEIGRRMADVIDETEEEASEHIDPHWELFYDDDHDEAQQIVHLHGDEKVPAKITTKPDGSAVAECTQCDETLDISAATRGTRATKDASPVS